MCVRINLSFLLLATFPLVAMPGLLRAAEPDAWVLEFQDDFQRAELGHDWISNDAEIRDGRMLVGRDRGATADRTDGRAVLRLVQP